MDVVALACYWYGTKWHDSLLCGLWMVWPLLSIDMAQSDTWQLVIVMWSMGVWSHIRWPRSIVKSRVTINQAKNQKFKIIHLILFRTRDEFELNTKQDYMLKLCSFFSIVKQTRTYPKTTYFTYYHFLYSVKLHLKLFIPCTNIYIYIYIYVNN